LETSIEPIIILFRYLIYGRSCNLWP